MNDYENKVDQRTNMAGENRLELLIFGLGSGQLFGVNVFKIREVIPCPKIAPIPGAPPTVKGITTVREENIPVIDLSEAIGMGRNESLNEIILKGEKSDAKCLLIICEYNQQVQALAIDNVERIVNMTWQEVKAPPFGAGVDHYLTSVTEVDDEIVGIIDVESVLSKVISQDENVEQTIVENFERIGGHSENIIIVDDSVVARFQLRKCLTSLGLCVKEFSNGRDALAFLKELNSKQLNVPELYPLVISDIEMPYMDGYTLTSSLRSIEGLKDLNIILHSSLSGSFNNALVEKVGADGLVAKFDANRLAETVITYYQKNLAA